MVERLCAMADLPKPKVAIMRHAGAERVRDRPHPEARRGRVTDGLWHRLEPKEIEGVLAHELSHIANRDVLMMTVASFFAMLAALLTRFGLYAGHVRRRRRQRSNNNNGPPVWLIVLVVSVVTYAISFVLIRTISRYREYAADRGSALITGAPEYLMSALQKISSQMTLIPSRTCARSQGMNAFFIIPAERQDGGGRAVHGSPAAREAPRRARRDRPRDGPAGRVARRVSVGLLGDVALRAQEARQPQDDRLFALSTARGHARDRARAEDRRRRRRQLQAALVRRVRARRERHRAAARGGRAESGSKIERKTRRVRLRVADRPRPRPRGSRRRPSHLIASELTDAGFGAQLLAAVFRSTAATHPVYWIYGFKRGAFWPFVPTGEDRSATTPRSSS